MIKPYFQDKWVTIYHGDCREILSGIQSISAVVTDCPYELGFMGKSWDSKGVSFKKETWQIIRNSCKSGAMMLSFGGTRTFHRIAVAIEDAGWEFRDTIMWLYGSGFPKSLDISKAIDKQAGVEREVIGQVIRGDVEKAKTSGVTMAAADANKNNKAIFGYGVEDITKPSTPEAKLWDGYGTALKPAFEPILVCMNPLDGTFANNALKHGVAGLNIDECRVATEDKPRIGNTEMSNCEQIAYGTGWQKSGTTPPQGRFPANIIHDGSQMVLDLFPDSKSTGGKSGHTGAYSGGYKEEYYGDMKPGYGDKGTAARFFQKCGLSIIELCSTLNYDTMNICKNIYVNTVESLLTIIQATTENIAHLNVEGLQDVQNDPLVKCAVNHADICEILTALVLVKIRSLDSNKEALQVMRDYTGNSKECTQLLNLVSSVEIKGNIDITQITINLLKSFGYVNPATTAYTQGTDWTEPKRFIYTPKASKSERNRGCEDLEADVKDAEYRQPTGNAMVDRIHGCGKTMLNNHPTVKPLALMEYLCKLVKYPEYNLILDPFMGSGTTLLACIRLGIPCIGIDSDEKSCEIASKRCSYEV